MTSEEKRNKFYKENPEIFNYVNEIRKINSIPGYEYTKEKYAEIKKYAIEHCKFYSNYTIDAEFPVMNKETLIANHEAILSNEVFEDPFYFSSTSGSTGTPFKVEQNRNKRLRNIADLKVYGEYALFESHDKMIQMRGYGKQKLDRTVDERENIWRFDIFDLSEDGGFEKLINLILSYKPKVIFSYTSAIETFCDYIINNDLAFDFRVNSILVGAESLTDIVYNKIQKVFKCPVFDRYSNMEMGIYAQREYSKTLFRINKASYYFECLQLDNDFPAKEGELGRLVFTDLENHAFPMIRYDTGDYGIYKIIDHEVYIESGYGRKTDQIFNTSGTLINPLLIVHGMRDFSDKKYSVKQWQFIQLGKNEYELKLNTVDKDIDTTPFIEEYKKILGDDAIISIDLVSEIPVLNSQKRKSIINMMNVKK